MVLNPPSLKPVTKKRTFLKSLNSQIEENEKKRWDPYNREIELWENTPMKLKVSRQIFLIPGRNVNLHWKERAKTVNQTEAVEMEIEIVGGKD